MAHVTCAEGAPDGSAVDDLAALSDRDLAQEIGYAIADSASSWDTFVADNSAPVIKDGTQFDMPLVMKYVPTNRARDYLPAPGQRAFDTPSQLFRTSSRSPTPNYFIGNNFYTWGRAVYVVGINEPLSTAMYGRVGLVSWFDPFDPDDTWKVFDVRDEPKAKLYLEWLRRQPHYPLAALTFDTGHWLHGLRNAFRAEFKIDVVLCKPDEQDAGNCYTRQTDIWLCVSDFEPDLSKDKPAGAVKLVDQKYSARFRDVRLVIVGEEEFVTPVDPNNPPRPPAPPPSRVAQLAVSGQPPTAPLMHNIADAYWQGRIVRVPS